MTENRFLLTKDLGALTEEERGLHLANVCEAAGLDPRGGLLRYMMLDDNSGTGQRRLVLYATKGATNAIRENKGIDITDLTYNVVGRAVVFTAKAKNKAGRTDIAVGAADVQSKTGKALENAFALAQTRATRRVTLQMSGLDLLDESEVFSDGTAPLVDAPLPLAEIGQPVEASGAVGVDITIPAIKLPVDTKVEFHVPLPPHVGETVVAVRQPAPVEEKRIPNPAAGLKPLSTNVLASPDGAAPQPTSPTTNQVVPEEVVKAKRRRRTKAEIEADRANTASVTPAPTPAPAEERRELPRTEPLKTIEDTTHEVIRETEAAATETPKKLSVGTKITKEQMDAHVARLTAYRDVFTEAGMIPSEGLGPSRKVREFVKICAAGTELGDMTKEQWESVFAFFDDVTAKHGTKALVATIEENIKKIPASA